MKNKKYANIKQSSIERCNEFSLKFFTILNGLFSSDKSLKENKKELLDSAKELLLLKDKDNGFDDYLKDSIFIGGHTEYMIPYYMMHTNDDVLTNDQVEKIHYSMLGNAKQIVSELE